MTPFRIVTCTVFDLLRMVWRQTLRGTLLGSSLAALFSAHADTNDLIAWWKFDRVVNGQTEEGIAHFTDIIGGNSKQTPGVLGTALKFDGFTTEIVRLAPSAPEPGNAFTVEAWLALGAYPWNWCPILDQSRSKQAGYCFAVGPRGQLSLQVAVDGKWVVCNSKDFVLPLRKWVHVAGTFAPGKGVTIFLDGQESGSEAASGKFTPAEDAELRIGVIDGPAKPSNIHREHGTLPGWFSLDGILDELKIHRRALSPAEVHLAFAAIRPPSEPDLPLRKLPSGPPGPGRFGAYYTNLKYYDEWDALWRVGADPDVLVRFDNSPVRVVFWRGTRYSPAWVSENELWMADQSVEAWGEGKNDAEGCFEHMQDPKCLYSHVRIIENTDARVVVHWRYAPVSAHNHLWRVDPKTGYACWIDEYYTIYPDATGVRKVTWQRGTLGEPRQFQESLPFTQVGQYCGDVVETNFCTVGNFKGESATLAFVENPEKTKPGLPQDLTVQRYNLRAQNDPFIIFEPGNQMEGAVDRNLRELMRPGGCNHWPVGQLACDGRTSQAPDHPTHFMSFPISDPPVHTNDTREWWNGLYGMTTKPVKELARLARSWVDAPALVVKGKGFENRGYDRGERAYQITCKGGERNSLEFELRASGDSPLINLPVVVRNWGPAGARLEIEGKSVARGKQFRYGHRHELEGSTLLIWVQVETVRPARVRLSHENP